MSLRPNKKPRSGAAETLAPDAPLGPVAAKLALAAPVAAAPSPHVKETLLARIRAAAENRAAPGWRFDSAQDASGWRASRIPGVRFKTLSVDEARDLVMLLMEMAPGSTFPDHVHALGAEEGLVLSGDVVTGGRLMRAGDYYFAAEGSSQGATVSPGGCTALLTLTARAWRQWRQQVSV
ncbi:MAG: cupin domain-containing protein [Opitutaceae bacterium]|nr:cupin domain-containing protein [Opitutaceae bacterium]